MKKDKHHFTLITDVIIEKVFSKPVFTRGSQSLIRKSNFRSACLAALRNADNGNVESLIAFARA